MSKEDLTEDETEVQRAHYKGLAWYYGLEVVRAQMHQGITEVQRTQIIREFERLKRQAQQGVELWTDE